MNRYNKKKISLRLRLAFMNIIILFIMCIILTLTANLSANKLVEAAQTTPATIIGLGEVADTYTIIDAKDNFKYESIYSMVIIIFIGSALTFYLSGKVLKPLTNFSKEVESRNINNLSERIIVEETGDEVESLIKAFNNMAEKINYAYINQKNFSVNAAHELRTPLAVLQSKIEVFQKKEDRTLDEYKNLVNIVGKNTERLSILVKDLLELTNEDDIALNESVYIKELIEECIFELEETAVEKNIEIKLFGDEISIKGNNNLLQRAFYNVIENAIKYNANNGEVIVTIIKENNNVCIKIADTGKGIPDNFKIDIFEPFTRVDKSRNREVGGNGLGLAIVKHIIGKHSGTIEVKNNTIVGSIFEIKLKL